MGLEHEQFVLATLHRPSNVDDPERLGLILRALAVLQKQHRVVLPIHPRTRARVREFGYESMLSSFVVMDPVGYVEMLALEDRAAAVITDSGGVQEETTVLGVPCLTVRETTERPVTVTDGTNTLVPWPPTEQGIVIALEQALNTGRKPVGSKAPEGWDGKAGVRIVDALAMHMAS